MNHIITLHFNTPPTKGRLLSKDNFQRKHPTTVCHLSICILQCICNIWQCNIPEIVVINSDWLPTVLARKSKDFSSPIQPPVSTFSPSPVSWPVSIAYKLIHGYSFGWKWIINFTLVKKCPWKGRITVTVLKCMNCSVHTYTVKLVFNGYLNTVKLVFRAHLNIPKKVSLHGRCPFVTGSLTWGR